MRFYPTLDGSLWRLEAIGRPTSRRSLTTASVLRQTGLRLCQIARAGIISGKGSEARISAEVMVELIERIGRE
jgi:hypothetical protein